MRQAKSMRLLFVALVFVAACGDGAVEDPLPPTQTARIGPEGGEIETSGARLIIPPGALDEVVELSIAPAGKPSVGDLVARSPVFRFGPAGTQFKLPVTVTMAFQAKEGDAPALYWSVLNDESQFERIEGTVVGNTLQGSIDHFSLGFVATERSDDGTGGTGGEGGGGGTGGSGGTGGVEEADVLLAEGVAPPTPNASQAAVAVGSQFVYWAGMTQDAEEQDVHALYWMPKAGGEAAFVETAYPISAVAVTGGKVFWIEYYSRLDGEAALRSMQEGGGEVKTLTGVVGGNTLVTDGEYLYFGSSNDARSIHRIPVDGGDAVAVAKSHENKPGAPGLLLLHGEELIWNQGGLTGFMRAPKAGGETSHNWFEGRTVTGFASDGKRLWMTTSQPDSLSDEEAKILHTPRFAPIHSPIYVGGVLIFTESLGASGISLAEGSKAAPILETKEGDPSLIAVDGKYVYYVNLGELRRLRLPDLTQEP